VIRVFKSEVIGQQISKGELEQLVAMFRTITHTTCPLCAARASCICTWQKEPQHWASRQAQYDRTSDYHLVYCPGFYKTDHFLMMSILKPDAHAQARNNNIMSNLAIMAAKFRARF